MKDPMLEIVSAVLDRSLFLGVAFTFFTFFFPILMVGGYNRKRVMMVMIHPIFWYFSVQHLASIAAKEGAFSGKSILFLFSVR